MNRADAGRTSVRPGNLALVLRQVFASDHPVSRAEIASVTGMTRSTASRLVDELVTGRLLKELDPVLGQRGRPAVPLVPPRNTHVALGLEVNVSHLAVRLVDLAGVVIVEQLHTGRYAGRDPAVVLGELAELGIRALQHRPADSHLVGVQLALPGLVDGARGMLVRAPNLAWANLAPRPLLTSAGLPCDGRHFGIGNEADFAALTVAQVAPGRPGPLDHFIYVSGEVGIGSAAVTGGQVMTGRHGWAGEIGHVCVDPFGPRCACGATGCLETYAGQHALLQRAGVADLEALHLALSADDTRAGAAIESAGRALGIALSAALNLLDLSQVVLGGHLGELADVLVPIVREQFSTRVLAAAFEAPQVTAVQLDLAPAALGAAYVALGRVLRDPARWLDGTW
jgi:predicted NBD/HSP70 family sugar kinase